MIAPEHIVFYNKTWEPLGSRAYLSGILSLATSIPHGALQGQNLECYSIAEKMSWAAKRRATRIEDTAYSLWGLFGVNLPLLYGEGEAAFRRLQE